MSYVFEGTVKLVAKVQEFDSGFKKREIIISSLDEKHQQDIKFEFLRDSADKLDGFKSGDLVKVSFELRGNEYNGKFYTNLVGTHIAKVKKNGKTEMPDINDAVMPMPEGEDDLPF